MKHTKGPWIVTKGSRYWVKSGDRKYNIAHVTNSRGDKNELTCQANARLIASAPDMEIEIERLKDINADLLEACKVAKIILDAIPLAGVIREKLSIIGYAIDKAKGG